MKVCSFNLHGLNQGKTYLEELCKTFDIVFVQEHWLAPFNLTDLNSISSSLTCYAVSAMADVISHNILRGRPFGGLAVFISNKLSSNVKVLFKSSRVLALQINDVVLINV